MCVRALRITVLKSAGNFTRDECHDLSTEKIQRVKCFMFTRCAICCVLAIFERRRGRLGSKISGCGQFGGSDSLLRQVLSAPGSRNQSEGSACPLGVIERTSSARSAASEKRTTRESRPSSTTTDCVAGQANHPIGRSSRSRKNIPLLARPKSVLELFPSQPTRGAYHDRHETRGGVRWTRQRQARNVMQGRSKDL
jgi:hypothetical protein